MAMLKPRVLQFVRRHHLIKAGDRVAIAVSGGADSVCLLRLLLELRDELGCVLSVAHLHHGLRGADADADAEFVGQLAQSYGLPFHLRRVDVAALARLTHLSLEAAGRRARLDFFATLHAEGLVDKVATAHTMDDQAETVLQKLLRGTGTRGIAGIFPIGTVAGVTLIRPLLESRRLEVEKYLSEIGQPWREDSSNTSSQFQRNRIRHELLPLLEREFNPGIRDALSITAEIARHEQDFWDTMVESALVNLRIEKDWLDLRAFSGLHPALQRRLLKKIAPLELDFEHIEAARRFIMAEQVGDREIARGLRLLLVRERGGKPRFSFQASTTSDAQLYCVKLPLPGEVSLVARGSRLVSRAVANPEFGTALAIELTGQELTIRNWQPGDRFQPVGRGEAKLKDFFQQLHVPAGERATWPVAEWNGEIVWVLGMPVSARFAAKHGNALVIEEVSSQSPSGE